MWSAPPCLVYANHVASAYAGCMKNPFRKAPLQQLETTNASLAKRGEQLVAKRVSAQEALNKAV
jgi:hypothetical protein